MSKTATLKIGKWTVTGEESILSTKIVQLKLKELISSKTDLTSALIRKATNFRGPIAIDTESKYIELWSLFGISYICSDSHFTLIEDALNHPINFNESYLQKNTGHNAPININHDSLQIAFASF